MGLCPHYASAAKCAWHKVRTVGAYVVRECMNEQQPKQNIEWRRPVAMQCPGWQRNPND